MVQCSLLDHLYGNSQKSRSLEDDIFLEGLLAEAMAFRENQAHILAKATKEAFNLSKMRADMQERISISNK